MAEHRGAEHDLAEELDNLDLSQVAALLEWVSPDSDAYDALREILLKINAEGRGRRGLTH